MVLNHTYSSTLLGVSSLTCLLTHSLRDDGLTFLLVEDSETIIKMTTKLLHSYGHKVYHAKDGEEAIRLYNKLQLQNVSIDIALMDDDMPVMTGTIHSLTHSLTQSLTHSVTHSLTHSLTK